MKEVKKRSKTLNFYLTIISLIKQSKSPYDVCSKFNIPKQNAKYYIKQLKDKGIIKKIGYGVWKAEKNAEEQVKQIFVRVEVEKPNINLHSLIITIPILKGVLRGQDWEIRHKFNNWLPKYKKVSILGGLTLKNNNNKSITVYAKTRDIGDLEEIDNLAFKIRWWIGEFCKKENVVLDIFNCQVKNLNIATRDKKAEGMVRKSEKFELDLNKKSEKIFEKDNINAKAWLDSSPWPFSVETNDKEWKREYLSMPFRIRDSFIIMENTLRTLKIQTEATSYLAENIKSHIPAWTSGANDTKKVLKIIKQIRGQMSQRKLTEFGG